MEQTLETLTEQTDRVQRYPQLKTIVSKADSAQQAENAANELEFPTPLLREVRLLYKLRCSYPEAFEVIQKNNSRHPMPEVLRVFPCSYKSKYSEDMYGTMLVEPHPWLPPIFWDYKLLDEDGDIIYSPKGIGEKYYRKNGFEARTQCVLSHGSKSLPAALGICFEKTVDGIKIEFTAEKKSDVSCYPAYTNSFSWTRHIDSRKTPPTEWFERQTGSSRSGKDRERVIFKTLTDKEYSSLDGAGSHDQNNEYWSLILETQVNVPLDEQWSRFSAYLVMTTYHMSRYRPWREFAQDEPLMFIKVERTAMAFHNSGSAHYMRSPFVFHLGIGENIRHNITNGYSDLGKTIDYIASRSPEHVNGSESLWYFFGFKNTREQRIYNVWTNDELAKNPMYTDWAPLPPWKQKVSK